MSLTIFFQQEEGGKVEPRYECPICLNWLTEPMLTSCGHRFCKKCIFEWMKTYVIFTYQIEYFYVYHLTNA